MFMFVFVFMFYDNNDNEGDGYEVMKNADKPYNKILLLPFLENVEVVEMTRNGRKRSNYGPAKNKRITQ